MAFNMMNDICSQIRILPFQGESLNLIADPGCRFALPWAVRYRTFSAKSKHDVHSISAIFNK